MRCRIDLAPLGMALNSSKLKLDALAILYFCKGCSAERDTHTYLSRSTVANEHKLEAWGSLTTGTLRSFCHRDTAETLGQLVMRSFRGWARFRSFGFGSEVIFCRTNTTPVKTSAPASAKCHVTSKASMILEHSGIKTQ